MKMTDKLFRAIMRNLHAYVLLINRDFTVFYTNYYDITGAVKPAETGRVGDILRCNNALSAAGGCGTHDLCEHCPVRNAIENAFVVQKNFTDLAAILNLRDSEGRTTECNAYVSGEYMEIEDNGRNVVLCHYPIPCFKNHFYGWYHLYGHVHNSFESQMMEHDKFLMEQLYDRKCQMFNVGAMMPWMDYTPRTLDEIIASVKEVRTDETSQA